MTNERGHSPTSDRGINSSVQLVTRPSSAMIRELRRGNIQEVERERKYVCQMATLQEHVDISNAHEQHIVQSYFPKDFGQMLVPLAVELHLISPVFTNLQITQARLRMVEQ
ncbi:MAG: hypothetical protein KDD70_18145, partial [Bdellovibrionales bacterium]|nr:hypothetical protein [Bdellovibrionales bacterium]